MFNPSIVHPSVVSLFDVKSLMYCTMVCFRSLGRYSKIDFLDVVVSITLFFSFRCSPICATNFWKVLQKKFGRYYKRNMHLHEVYSNLDHQRMRGGLLSLLCYHLL